jgi:hypothetical protein
MSHGLIQLEIEVDGNTWEVSLIVDSPSKLQWEPASAEPTKEKFEHVLSQMRIDLPGWVQTQTIKEP